MELYLHMAKLGVEKRIVWLVSLMFRNYKELFLELLAIYLIQLVKLKIGNI